MRDVVQQLVRPVISIFAGSSVFPYRSVILLYQLLSIVEVPCNETVTEKGAAIVMHVVCPTGNAQAPISARYTKLLPKVGVSIVLDSRSYLVELVKVTDKLPLTHALRNIFVLSSA
jgi:hypothetical protein